MLVDLEAGKSTGPDGISLEALQAMMQNESWESRIRYMLDDFLYKGTLPPPVLAGVTVLLPKTAGPRQACGDTRPITLSSAILKWLSYYSSEADTSCRTGIFTSGPGGDGKARSC